MKTTLLFLALFLAVTIGTSSAKTPTGVSKYDQKERGITTFYQPVNLLGIELKGEYLFVHDNAAMMRGEACTFVYKGTAELPNKLVVSFHCKPESRNKATHFTVRTTQTSPGVNEVAEIQFAGSSESHLVPMAHNHVVGVIGW
jgi:hypothetical protein